VARDGYPQRPRRRTIHKGIDEQALKNSKQVLWVPGTTRLSGTWLGYHSATRLAQVLAQSVQHPRPQHGHELLGVVPLSRAATMVVNTCSTLIWLAKAFNG
jgi:hypothetical protein